MQAIITKYHGPTNNRGSRISASCEAGRIYIDYPHELSGEDVHRAAADALCEKLEYAYIEHIATRPGFDRATYSKMWDSSKLVGGGTKTGYCFVFVG